HPADLFDLAARDRLAVGDQGQRFQGRAGVAGLALGPQPRHPGVHVGLDLVTEAGRDLDQLHAAFGAVLGKPFQRRFHAAGRGGLLLRKQRVQLRQGQRLVGRQQGGLDDAVDQRLVHGSRRVWGKGEGRQPAAGSAASSPSSNSLWNCSGSLVLPTASDLTWIGASGASWTMSSNCSLASSSSDRKVTSTPSRPSSAVNSDSKRWKRPSSSR